MNTARPSEMQKHKDKNSDNPEYHNLETHSSNKVKCKSVKCELCNNCYTYST